MGADFLLRDNSVLYSKMSLDEISINVPSLNEDLIREAVNFILNPKLLTAPQAAKEAFLKTKGLTPEEIRIAFDRSYDLLPSRNYSVPQSYHLRHAPVSRFKKFREILETVALITGVTYGLYYFIKHVIVPFLFGKPKKPSGTEGAVLELQETVKASISQLRSDVQKVHEDLEKVVVVQSEQQAAVRNLGDIRSEVATVKGILLSRHQFPSVNLAGSTSIPAWQMAACGDSGDRSSEVEIAPRSNGGSQGSDSSLEMIKETEVAEVDS